VHELQDFNQRRDIILGQFTSATSLIKSPRTRTPEATKSSAAPPRLGPFRYTPRTLRSCRRSIRAEVSCSKALLS